MVELYEKFYIFTASYTNPIYQKMFLKELERAEKKALSMPDSWVGGLVRKSMLSAIRIYRKWYDFLVDGYDPRQAIDDIFGKGTWKTAIEYVKEYWKLEAELNEKFGYMVSRFTTNQTPGCEQKSREMAQKIVELGREWMKEKGMMPEGFEFSVEFLPVRLGPRSWWDPRQKKFMFALGRFACTVPELPESSIPCFTFFHEMAHAIHQHNSEKMPEEAQFSHEIGYSLPHKVHIEGFAMFMEELGLEFMKQFRDELGISDDMIEYRKKGRDYMIYNQGIGIVLAVAKEMESIEGVRPADFIMEIFGNRSLSRKVSSVNLNTLDILAPDFSYAPGLVLMEKLSSKFSPTALSTGVWTWEVLPEAAEFFS